MLDPYPPRPRSPQRPHRAAPCHALLIDDPEKTVIEPLTAAAGTMETVYDFDLMENGGHIKGLSSPMRRSTPSPTR